MTVQIDVEGYAAEKHLRDLSKTDKNKLRAERKRKKKERLAILAKISEYETKLCDSCKGKPDTYKCDCVASRAIQDLGKRLGGESVIGRPKRTPLDDFLHITPETFNKQVYQDMKDAELTDRNVLSLLGWYPNRLNNWKREHGLLGKKNPQKKRQPQKEIKGLTVEAYQAYKKDKQSDRAIGDKYGIAQNALWIWKKDNGLIADVKPQQAVQQPKGEKMMNDEVKLQEPLEVNYKAKYEDMKKQFESAVKDYSELKSESLGYRKRIEELEEALNQSSQPVDTTEFQQEIWKLTREIDRLQKSQVGKPDLHSEIDRLKNCEKDYRNLEVDFRNVHTENERLKIMLERLKHTAQINVWLMEQHVGFHKQLDEVMGYV